MQGFTFQACRKDIEVPAIAELLERKPPSIGRDGTRCSRSLPSVSRCGCPQPSDATQYKHGAALAGEEPSKARLPVEHFIQPQVLSPEQLQAQGNGQEIDARSDIFSFGLIE